VIKFIEGYKLTNYNQIIELNHWGDLFNINLEQYFGIKYFDIDKVNSSQLNSKQLLHKEKFCEKVKEYIQSTNLNNIIEDHCHINASDKILEMINW